MHARVLTFQDYLAIAIRRKWLILGIVLCSLGAAYAWGKVLPKSYRSTTLILVESQKIPEDYVKGVVMGTVHDRLNTIQQMLLSRTLLDRVIEMSKPYGESQGADRDAAIERMRKAITITTSRDVMLRDQTFSISFVHENPAMAMKVTSTLASLLIQENLSTREQLVETASQILTSELDRAKEELEAREKAVSEFKRMHMGELPQQMEANLRALDRIQVEVLTQTEALSNLNTRLAMIEKAIKEYETTGTTSTELPASSRKGDRRFPRLKELERNLATLSAIYKQNYPDVVQLKEEIAKLKTQPQAENDELVDVMPMQEGKSGGAKPVDPYLRELTRQRNELKIEIASNKDRQSRLAAQIKEYEGRVERTPAREQKLMSLVRDYENMQKNYQSLLEKKLSARIAENLERRQKGEQFRIIDPANLPGYPEKPNKMRIMLAGLALGCGLGMGTAVGIEWLKRGFRDPEEAETLLGLPVLATIPFFQSAFGGAAKSLPLQTGVPALPLNVKEGRLLSYSSKSIIRSERATHGPTAAGRFSPEWNLVTKWRPMSVVAEQFRVAATRLALMGAERSSTVIVVTSAVMGEGKSSSAVNLAYVLAQDLGKRTLLIDCDLKRPAVHKYAGVPLEPGLADVLHGGKSLDTCLQRLEEVSLWILPAGSMRYRSIGLLKTQELHKILTELRSRFEHIILDAPPILPLADMNVLAKVSDVLALVVLAATTGRDVVQKAFKTLRDTSQAGIILNGIEAESTPYYMQQEYYLGTDVEKRL